MNFMPFVAQSYTGKAAFPMLVFMFRGTKHATVENEAQ